MQQQNASTEARNTARTTVEIRFTYVKGVVGFVASQHVQAEKNLQARSRPERQKSEKNQQSVSRIAKAPRALHPMWALPGPHMAAAPL